MTDLGSRIKQAWVQAEEDLEIEVDLGGVLPDRQGDVPYLVLIPGFGAPGGCAVAAFGAVPERFVPAAKSNGVFPSVLAESYAEYEPSLFINTLDDWGWFGTGEPPTWYSGRPWGSE